MGPDPSHVREGCVEPRGSPKASIAGASALGRGELLADAAEALHSGGRERADALLSTIL
jgi:hypothetical protein